MQVHTAVEAADRDEDRVLVIPHAGAHLLLLADGAGGLAGGRHAAEGALAEARARVADLVASGPRECEEALRAIDRALAARGPGETTCVLAVVREGEVLGASVGDSAAWVVWPGGRADLTRAQVRKPLLGSGWSMPVGFGPAPLRPPARLLMGSDGLVKYTSPERLCRAAMGDPAERAVQSLIECVRLPSGRLQDDVAVILCAP